MATDPFTEFLINHPRQSEKVFQLNAEGQQFLLRGRLKEAERRFRQAFSICEYAIPVLNNMALISLMKKDLRRAVKRSKMVIKYHLENVFAHCTMAEGFARLGRREQAISYIDRALEIYQVLGVAALPDHLNKIIEALGILELDGRIYQLYEAYDRDEDSEFYPYLDPMSWFRFGVAAANLGRFQEARELWN